MLHDFLFVILSFGIGFLVCFCVLHSKTYQTLVTDLLTTIKEDVQNLHVMFESMKAKLSK